jgi:hypothetical protein
MHPKIKQANEAYRQAAEDLIDVAVEVFPVGTRVQVTLGNAVVRGLVNRHGNTWWYDPGRFWIINEKTGTERKVMVTDPSLQVLNPPVVCYGREDEMIVLHQGGKYVETLYASCPEQAHDFVAALGKETLEQVSEWRTALSVFSKQWASKYPDPDES